MTYFYSRPCGRGDSPRQGHGRRDSDFYSRPCGRGDDQGYYGLSGVTVGFLLTPLREGRRDNVAAVAQHVFISTHAPAGGATRAVLKSVTKYTISTHAPAGGATVRLGLRGGVRIGLISTHAPAGGATQHSHKLPVRRDISTHAPAGGATRGAQPNGRAGAISTHAPAGGATRPFSAFWRIPRRFLLTPLREGRRCIPDCRPSRPDFYSRPCGRGDLSYCGLSDHGSIISTHAPAGGATGWQTGTPRLDSISTHAPAGGATSSGASGSGIQWVFLLTPLREGRRNSAEETEGKAYFYSRPCGRGDSNFPQVRHEVLRQIAER